MVNLSNAQPYFDVVSVQTSSANQFPFNDDEKVSLKQNWIGFNFNYAKKLNSNNIFVATAGFEQFLFSNNDSLRTQSFNSFYLPLTIRHTWKDTTWTTSFSYIPKLHSYTPISINENTMQQGGAIVVSHAINNHFKYSIGFYFNQEFFGNNLLPLLGMEWKASPRLNLFGLLPNKFIVDYRVNRVFHTGFAFKGITTSFRFKPSSYADYYRMDEGQLKLFTDFYITKTLVFNFEGGVIVNRRYDVKFKDTNPSSLYRARKSTIFKLGLYYRLWL